MGVVSSSCSHWPPIKVSAQCFLLVQPLIRVEHCKSNKPFLRIRIESDTPEVYFRPFNQPMPTRIVIINGLQDYWTGFTPGYKRFKNVTIQTKACFLSFENTLISNLCSKLRSKNSQNYNKASRYFYLWLQWYHSRNMIQVNSCVHIFLYNSCVFFCLLKGKPPFLEWTTNK